MDEIVATEAQTEVPEVTELSPEEIAKLEKEEEEKKQKRLAEAQARYDRVKGQLSLCLQLGEPASSLMLANIKGVKDFKLTMEQWEAMVGDLNCDREWLLSIPEQYQLLRTAGVAGDSGRIALAGFKTVAALALDEDNNVVNAELAELGRNIRTAVEKFTESISDSLKALERYGITLEFYASNDDLKKQKAAEKKAKLAALKAQQAGTQLTA